MGIRNRRGRPTEFTREDCIEALRTATERLGRAPTILEYQSLGLRPSSATIRNRLGGWTRAKRSAGVASGESRIESDE
ncbi:homing endonuclease associated repeat-containing protein [Halegenticoccus tardaugens]|uniref:homing endonuclease associated repeat-containing protein n=1 Tax=Halegenticoccus tardaugens TaxID=2071624 RepID=UPI00100C10B1|nr:hypothetical protein [Halegenticoccus tardaugens]